MVERRKTRYGWEFLFLGANIDAVETAARFGIAEERAVNFHNDRRGVAVNYDAVSRAVGCVRSGARLQRSWKASITEDFDSREADR